jgi:CelD/BcsL family acetyltransferase involved in cellulose biosynthesis
LGDPLSQYSDILMTDAFRRELTPEGLRNAFAILPRFDVFSFRRVRDDAKISKFMRGCGAEPASQSAAPFADLGRYADFNDFLKSNWKAHRNRNRLRRRAQQEGGLTFELAGSPERAAALTRHTIELKRQWLRSRFRLFGTLSSLP